MNNKVKLTKTQLGIYVESINNPKSTLYNIPLFGKLPKDFNIPKLKKAIETVAKIHPALNSHLEADEDGEIYQVINEKKIDIKVTKLTDEEFEKIKPKLVRPFKLLKDNLARFEIYITPKASYLFEDFHHIMFDLYSFKILSRDISKAYKGEEIEEEKLKFYDISKMEQDKRNSEEFKVAKDFYTNLLKDSDEDTPIVYELSDKTPEQGWLNYEFSIDNKALKNIILTAKTSATGFFTSVFGFVVAKYNYSNHSTITTIFNGRNERGVANTISMFVQTFPFVTDLNSNPEIEKLLKNNFANLRLCRNNDIYSFTEIAEEFGITSDISFAFQGKYAELQLIEGFDIKQERIYDNKHVENSSIIFELIDLNNGNYRIHIGYRKDRYSDEFAKNLCKCFVKVSNEFLIKKNVNDVELVDDELICDIEKINKTEVKYDETKTVIDLFKSNVKQSPNNIALCFKDKKYTYKELDLLTDKIAKYIKSEKLKKEDVVGIYLPRCDYIAILALSVLKANCAYLPIDDSYPDTRINFMIKDSNAKLIFTTKEYVDHIENYDGKIFFIEDIDNIKDVDITLKNPNPKDLFVILYTSGSTGIPKGVLLEHKNILAMSIWSKRSKKATKKSKFANYASFGFDAHLFDFYPCFISGAELHIIPSDIRLDLLEVQKYFNKNGITHTTITTQVGRQFALLPGTKTLEHLTVGGEKLIPLKPPKYNFYNAYGPTECTVLACYHKVDKKEENIPIGKPGENIKLYVVDNNGKLLPKGATGELWISGNQVSRGYLHRPQVTRKAFTKNPFSTKEGYERVYHTGDVVRFLEDGNVQFVGRKDSQVKIRGFRIELTEIENVILE